MNYTAFNAKLAVEPVHIRPFQRKAFADAQSEAHAQKSDCVEWSLKLQAQPLKLFHAEAALRPYSLRRAFDADKFHRIALHRDISAPHCKVPHHADKSPDVNLALRRERERLQP